MEPRVTFNPPSEAVEGFIQSNLNVKLQHHVFHCDQIIIELQHNMHDFNVCIAKFASHTDRAFTHHWARGGLGGFTPHLCGIA